MLCSEIIFIWLFFHTQANNVRCCLNAKTRKKQERKEINQKYIQPIDDLNISKARPLLFPKKDWSRCGWSLDQPGVRLTPEFSVVDFLPSRFVFNKQHF